jgi:hypothetical protein
MLNRIIFAIAFIPLLLSGCVGESENSGPIFPFDKYDYPELMVTLVDIQTVGEVPEGSRVQQTYGGSPWLVTDDTLQLYSPITMASSCGAVGVILFRETVEIDGAINEFGRIGFHDQFNGAYLDWAPIELWAKSGMFGDKPNAQFAPNTLQNPLMIPEAGYSLGVAYEQDTWVQDGPGHHRMLAVEYEATITIQPLGIRQVGLVETITSPERGSEHWDSLQEEFRKDWSPAAMNCAEW